MFEICRNNKYGIQNLRIEQFTYFEDKKQKAREIFPFSYRKIWELEKDIKVSSFWDQSVLVHADFALIKSGRRESLCS